MTQGSVLGNRLHPMMATRRALMHLAVLALFSCGVALADEISFDIPAQPASEALTRFAEQSGISLLFPYNEISTIRTNRLVGNYSIEDGLEALLLGTGLSASIDRRTQAVIRVDAAGGDERAPDRQARVASDRTGLFSEVVVTARRREESFQDVPISMAAISGQEIELRNVENIIDLNAFLPNVSISGGGTSGGSEGQFVIRGIPGVARYVDGVVQQANEGSLINLLDLERIEILRGPQGTLFGKNAIGGAIQYVTRKPGAEFATRLRATAGSFNRRDIVASVDAPLGTGTFTGLTAASLNRDGYVESDISGLAYGEQKNNLVRGQLLWQPSAAFSLALSFDHSEIDEQQQANVLYDVIDWHPTVIDYNSAGLVFTDETHAYGGRQHYRNRSLRTETGNLWRSNGFSLNLGWQLHPRITLRSITGGRSYEWGNFQDLDASEFAFFEQWFYREGTEFSQELQLQGSTRRLDWTIGAYYASDERDGLAVRWQYEEIAPRPRDDVTSTMSVDTAVFGEATYRPDDQWAFTAGVRYTREEFSNAVFLTAAGRPPVQVISTDLSRGPPIGRENSAGFSSVTPRLTLQYDFSDAIMAYLTYAEGFNGGGINGGAPINDRLLEFDSESLAQYELGMRSTVLEGNLRLNASYFHGYWDDIQISEVLVPGQLTTRNAGSARIRGFEVDGTWRATDNLVFNTSLAWLDADYRRLDNTTTIRLTTEFALAPAKSAAAAATYQWWFGSGGALRLRVDYGWVDEHVTIDDFRLQKTQPAYGLLGSRLVYTSPDERWDLALIGSNLTDKWYQLGGFAASLGGVDQGVPSRPREIGVSLGIRL